MRRKEIQHGIGVRLELLLKTRPSSALPAGLQWEFKLPAGMQIEDIEEGKAVKKAGKTIVCNGAKCLVYGLNRTTIPNGQVAVAKIRVAQSLDGAKGSAQFGYQSQSRDKKENVQIADVVATSVDGKAIKVVASDGETSASNAP